MEKNQRYQTHNLQGIVLAAHKTVTTQPYKNLLLEDLCGQPVITYSLKTLHKLTIPTTVVINALNDPVHTCLQNKPVTFVVQHNAQGSAHAVLSTQEHWRSEHIVIVNGNMPLITPQLITQLYDTHITRNADLTLCIAHNPDPTLERYNRVTLTHDQLEITPKDRLATENACCIDAGIYLVKQEFLEQWFTHCATDTRRLDGNCSDIVRYARDNKHTIATVTSSFDTVRSVHTLEDLWICQQIQRAHIIRHWMRQGVTFASPQTSHIDQQVTIGPDTHISASVHLTGATAIGNACMIKEFSLIKNSTLFDRVTVQSHCVIEEACIDQDSTVGPFAHLRPGTTLQKNVTIGNFVEVNRSTIGHNSKAKHLTYLGDTTIGKNSNIGAGTITCNYDGQKKHPTTIGDNTFIGSNTTIVAPTTIGNNAFTAAGSTITQDVPDNALAIGRARQVTKHEYADKLPPNNSGHKHPNFCGTNQSFDPQTSQPS